MDISSADQPSNVWVGQHIRLRSVEPDDWETHFRWDQDSTLGRNLERVYPPKSREASRRWAEQMTLQRGEDDQFHFEIETLAGEPVGSIATNECNPRVGSFSYGVAILPQHFRKGYASEAICLVLRYYFQELRYQKVTVRVFSFNEPSLRLHERLGFQQEGRLRRMVYTRGRHYDEVIFGMTTEEFATKHTDLLAD